MLVGLLEEVDENMIHTDGSANGASDLRDEQHQAGHDRNVGVWHSGLRGDLQRDGGEAASEALDDLFII
jgi:hypothetical protein